MFLSDVNPRKVFKNKSVTIFSITSPEGSREINRPQTGTCSFSFCISVHQLALRISMTSNGMSYDVRLYHPTQIALKVREMRVRDTFLLQNVFIKKTSLLIALRIFGI